MDQSFLQVMLALGILLILSVFASKISSRYGIPILLIFIAAGMLSGSEGPGGIVFEDAGATRILGTIALSFILFSGGLSTQLKAVAPVWKESVVLALVGVLVSTSIMAVFIRWVMDWGWIPSALLGACISSTDAAAVFGIIKTRKLHLKSNIQSTIELESGSNDPMAVFLTLTLIQLYQNPESFSMGQTLMHFFIQMSLGGLAGWFMGQGLVKVINWLDLEFEGLYPVLTIAGVICIYALTEFCGGNGFLAVYLAGLTMGEEKYFSKKGLEVFHDGLAWLMQVAMFLALGLLINPSQLMPIAGPGIILAISLMLVARPLSVFLCLVGFRYNLREILFISWGGLRGAVPIILATYILVSGGSLAPVMFNLVFFIVILCMLVQGTSIAFFARLLGVQEEIPVKRRLPFKSRTLNRDFIEFEVGQDSPFIGQTILDLHLPEDVLVVLIHRQEDDFIPRGNTEIEGYDRLVCLADKNVIPKLEEILRPIQTF
ncbi:MAG TPA: potassium/proton antiporter [Bacteriovoracaceae bacterium]|nr:potassium/proton antiporter [Bacteriovoracaceae bacterium]